MSHLEEGLLHALLDGEIPSAELPPIQAHLAACAECRARLEEQRQFRAEADGLVEMVEAPALGSGEGTDVPARRPTRMRTGRRWREFAWAASLVAATGLGYAARGWRAPLAFPSEPLTQSAVKAESVGKVAFPPLPASPTASTIADRVETRDRGASGPSRKLAAAPMKERSETSVVAPREEAKVAAPTSSLSAAQALRGDQPKPGQLRLDEVVVSGEGGLRRTAKLAAPPASRPDTISFQDALSRLGGTMRLIEGLVPVRLEGQGAVVFVVYPLRGGELRLAQQRVDGRVEYRLIAPPDFPADSLERLRARVRE